MQTGMHVKMWSVFMFVTCLNRDWCANVVWTQTNGTHRYCWHDAPISGARIIAMTRYCIPVTMEIVISYLQTTQTDLFVHILRIFVFYYREFQFLYNLGLRQCRYISYASWNKFNIGWDNSANRGSQDGENILGRNDWIAHVLWEL